MLRNCYQTNGLWLVNPSYTLTRLNLSTHVTRSGSARNIPGNSSPEPPPPPPRNHDANSSGTTANDSKESNEISEAECDRDMNRASYGGKYAEGLLIWFSPFLAETPSVCAQLTIPPKCGIFTKQCTTYENIIIVFPYHFAHEFFTLAWIIS